LTPSSLTSKAVVQRRHRQKVEDGFLSPAETGAERQQGGHVPSHVKSVRISQQLLPAAGVYCRSATVRKGLRFLRIAAALALVSAWAAGGRNDLRTSYWAWLKRLKPSAVAQTEQRLRPAGAVLPRHGVVGYLSDEDSYTTPGMRRYYLTQYALAPLVVSRSTRKEFVLGNFREPSKAAELARQNGLSLERDFGDGLMIFRRKAP